MAKVHSESFPDLPHLHEDLPGLVVTAVRQAAKTCKSCRSYHGLWPAFRLSGSIGGVSIDWPVLLPLLRSFAPGREHRRWLIAGAADSAVLATVAMALGEHRHDVEVTIVELCETPLALCRDYANRVGMNVRTFAGDLFSFNPDEGYDLIFGHSILGHIPTALRFLAARNFRAWLKPGGPLVHGLSVPSLDEPHMTQDAFDRRFGIVVDACREAGVTDEAVLSRLAAWLPEWQEQRVARVAQRAGSSDIELVCREAGFVDVVVIAHDIDESRRSGRLARRRRMVLTASAPA
jgi:hypothetical protein